MKCYNTWWHREHKEFIPCGKCEGCRKRMISAWSVRLLWENRNSISSSFITLTYDDKSLPVSKRGYSTLRKRDVQLFFKRLRKAHTKLGETPKRPIKYFCVGEYGGKIGRPHYHIILFNADIRKIQDAWSQRYWYLNKVERKRWSYGTIRGAAGELYKLTKKKVWKHSGQVHYGDKRGVNGASVGYCLKYILEPKDDSAAPLDYDAAPEFRLMSKGLGISYLNGRNMQWHYDDLPNRMYMEIELGKKIAMPRYYKDRIYDKKSREVVKKHSRFRMVDSIFRDLVVLYNMDIVKELETKRGRRNAANHRQRLLKIKNKKLVYAKG